MDKSTNKQPMTQAAVMTIVYRGPEAKGEAERLYMALQASRMPLEPVSEVGQGEDRLGTPEIIITILVTAAVKALSTTALKYLEDYLRERAGGKGQDLRIQVVVKHSESHHRKKFLLNLRQSTTEAAISFSENIRQAIAVL